VLDTNQGHRLAMHPRSEGATPTAMYTRSALSLAHSRRARSSPPTASYQEEHARA
jgi:hypothetical protein